MPKNIIAKDLDETYSGFHSNRLETELAMLAKEKTVKINKAKDNFVNDRELLSQKFNRDYMPDCIDGFPTKATLKKAKNIFNLLINKLEIITSKIKS